MELEVENEKTNQLIGTEPSRPDASSPAEQLDGNGYEWLTHSVEARGIQGLLNLDQIWFQV